MFASSEELEPPELDPPKLDPDPPPRLVLVLTPKRLDPGEAGRETESPGLRPPPGCKPKLPKLFCLELEPPEPVPKLGLGL